MNVFKLKSKKAFTVAELLIVLLVVTLIISLVVAFVSDSRSKGRDVKRISDINQIQIALENYKNIEGHYPEQLDFGEKLMGSSDVNIVFMEEIPQNSNYLKYSCPYDEYYYESLEFGNFYQISFCLENDNNSLDKGLKCANPYGISNNPCP